MAMQHAVCVDEHGSVVRRDFQVACLCQFDVDGRMFVGPVAGLRWKDGEVVFIPIDLVRPDDLTDESLRRWLFS